MMIGGGKVRDVTELNSVVIRHPLSFTIPKCSCNTKVQSVGPTISGSSVDATEHPAHPAFCRWTRR